MKKLLLVMLVAVQAFTAAAQEKPRYWDDVQVIKKFDQMYTPPAHPLLFIGSSSIRKWGDLERTFAPFTAMNRGIGGAIVNDIIFYLNDIVFPYQPKQIVIYVGDNDVAKEEFTADTILQHTKELLTAIRAKLPEVPVVYISIKPSPARAKWMDKIKAANQLIRDYVSSQKQMQFVDIFKPMQDAKGNNRPDLFLQDMVHMNSKGYDIWRKALLPYLKK
ncbi:GDSL-type esterase/lipase family protein [Chitinophaga sp. sic0106]|uniref:GDSL-type esterase/lipase family protein n=1 Tax=Chitinophaga sp. sic0106 TaxID=2854785 RepID=UPI001C4565B3|nr:GDSL-type esterase/lipase family protein [Chitinophaga sp. sic0106]MBV7530320.1 GDSL family lipase [Chitinophaga sp. sic0106]